MVDLANSRDFVRNPEKESIRRWYRLILSSNTSAPGTFLLARHTGNYACTRHPFTESSVGRLCIMNVVLRDPYGGIDDTIVQLFDT
jgi:hypothetical protein